MGNPVVEMHRRPLARARGEAITPGGAPSALEQGSIRGVGAGFRDMRV